MSVQKERMNGDISNPTLIPFAERSRKIVAGSNYSYSIVDEKVLRWGFKGAVLLSEEQKGESKASKEEQVMSDVVTIPIKVDEIATDKVHTFAWNDQQVYCWGSNQYYELGLQEQRQYGLQRMEVLQTAIGKGYRLKSVSCGQHHTLAVFFVDQNKGEGNRVENFQSEVQEKSEDYSDSSRIQLFAWGQSESYQLTINSQSIIPYPVLTPCSFHHLEEIYSKSDYNVVICNGKVYSWGCNLFSRLGQLVASSQLPKVRVPRLIVLPEKIVKIGMGTYHVVAVSQNGSAFSWGKGNLGQLGIDRFEAESKPNKVICSELIKDVSCGQSHTLILLQDGRLMTCGSNSHEVLGHLSFDPKDKKKRAKKLQFVINSEQIGEIVMISCGCNHNLVLNKEGSIFGWGSNQFYQVLPQSVVKSKQGHKSMRDRKSLQIVIDMDIDCEGSRLKGGTSVQQKPLNESWRRLQDWRVRYKRFLAQREREQSQFMRQFQQIMGKSVADSVL